MLTLPIPNGDVDRAGVPFPFPFALPGPEPKPEPVAVPNGDELPPPTVPPHAAPVASCCNVGAFGSGGTGGGAG